MNFNFFYYIEITFLFIFILKSPLIIIFSSKSSLFGTCVLKKIPIPQLNLITTLLHHFPNMYTSKNNHLT